MEPSPSGVFDDQCRGCGDQDVGTGPVSPAPNPSLLLDSSASTPHFYRPDLASPAPNPSLLLANPSLLLADPSLILANPSLLLVLARPLISTGKPFTSIGQTPRFHQPDPSLLSGRPGRAMPDRVGPVAAQPVPTCRTCASPHTTRTDLSTSPQLGSGSASSPAWL